MALAAVMTLPTTGCGGGNASSASAEHDKGKLDTSECAPTDEFCGVTPGTAGSQIPSGSGVPISDPADPSQLPGIDADYSADEGSFSNLRYAPDDGQHKQVAFCEYDGNPIPAPSEAELNSPPPDGSQCLLQVVDPSQCPVDPSTLTDQTCSSDADCGTGVCGSRCADPQCLNVEHLCGQRAASCYGLEDAGDSCEDYNLCAEDGATETPDTHAEHQQELDEQLTETKQSSQIDDSQKTAVPDYAAVEDTFCFYGSDIGDLHDNASKPAIETPKKKWGVYLDHSIDYGIKPAKNPHWISELQDLHGGGKFAVGGIIWGNKLEALNAEARITLTDCGVDLTATAQLFGESVVAFTAETGQKYNADLVTPGHLATPAAAKSNCEGAKQAAKDALQDVRKSDLFAREVAQYYNDNSLTPELCRMILATVPKDEQDVLGGPYVCDDVVNMEASRKIDILQAWKKEYDVKTEAYPKWADALGVAHQQVEMDGTLDVFDIKPDKPYDLKILDVDLPIGPIDLNLAVEGYGSWNIQGGLQWGLGFSKAFDTGLSGVSDVFHNGSPNIGDIRAYGGPVITPSLDLGVLAFVGVGIPGVSVGIEGQIDLLNVKLPMSAVAAAMRVSEDDRRDVSTTVFAGAPKAGMAPKTYRWVLGYHFGASLNLHELDGKLDLAARLHILFFKKTFRMHLFNWTGFQQNKMLVAGGDGNDIPYEGDLGQQGDTVAYTEVPPIMDANPKALPMGPIPRNCMITPD